MIVSLTNPKGVDYWIAKLNSWLQEALFPVWGIDPEDPEASAAFIFYPRVYRNPTTDNGYIAELWTENNEYKEVYYDDTKKGCAWYGIGQLTKHDSGSDAVEVHLIAWGNVKQLYPGVAHRADNEFRLSFESILKTDLFGFSLESTEIGLDRVLREYPGSRRQNRLIACDMGDVHAFRCNLTLLFNPAESCDSPTL